MKSENDANPAADEEVIELTDVVKSGPDAEEAIIDLTDPVETVKAEPHDPSYEPDDETPLDLDDIAAEDAQEVVDLTDPLAPLEDTLAPGASEVVSLESEEVLDLNDALADGTEEALDLDLGDTLDGEAETVLDLDEALDNDDATLDLTQAVADAEKEIEADPEVLDLAEVLDSAGEAEGFLELDTPLDEASEAEAFETQEALEVIEADPEALTDDLLDEDGLADLSLFDDVPAGDISEAEAVLDLDSPLEAFSDEAAPAERPTAVSADADEASDEASEEGDELEFKLDEMLAEAQADMPGLDDDDAEMELDLSEALADAAADNDGAEAEAEVEAAVDDPLEEATLETDEDDEGLDLISADNIIDLDETSPSDTIVAEADAGETAPHNVIDLAEVTGGYPTVTPTLDTTLFAAGEDTPAEEEEDTELNAEMQKLEATLDDVFQDDEGDGEDLNLGIFADADADGGAATEDTSMDGAEADVEPPADAPTAALGAAALGAVAAGTAATGAESSGETMPAEIPDEALDAALERVIKTMYADRIEQMILDVIKEAVSAEIDKVKRSLGDGDTTTTE